MRRLTLLTLLLLPACGVPAVRSGADRLLEPPYRDWIRGQRLGIVTNHTGIRRDFEPLFRRLEREPEMQVTALFAPEHGFAGQAQAGDEVESTRSVFSLYGAQRAPTPEMLEQVDLLIYDIQDVGTRFYTYISTLYECLRAAAQAGVPVLVLDRPNPLGGVRVEGPVLEPGMESFVGIFRLPIRYGLTVGELAELFDREAQLGADLRVVPLQGWSRDRWFDQTGLPWLAPSPNMPTLETAVVYPGFCLIEGTNLSEGRGTTRPFQLVGAPWLEAEALAGRLNGLGLAGVHFRPQPFTPTFSKYAGEDCRGVQVHVVDRERFRPVEAAVHFLVQARRLHPDRLELRDGFDRLAGNGWMRRQILAGRPAEEIIARWAEPLAAFAAVRQTYLRY